MHNLVHVDLHICESIYFCIVEDPINCLDQQTIVAEVKKMNLLELLQNLAEMALKSLPLSVQLFRQLHLACQDILSPIERNAAS